MHQQYSLTSSSTSETKDIEVEKRFDAKTDRLFLVYYALPGDFINANKWGVTERSLPVNIKSAINKPVIIYRKNANNPFHTKQAGNFVHPTLEEARAELGKPSLTEPEYYQWQEKYAVGRIREVERRGDRGYAWTLEITDPDAKQILRSDDYKNGVPGWTSPQILTYPNVYPDEERAGINDHWVVSHVILTDQPAYGFTKSSIRGKCFGAEKECLIKTKSASNENLGFCVKQATQELIDSRSSLRATQTAIAYNKMSAANESQQPQPTGNEVLVTKTFSEQNPKQEGDQRAPPEGSDHKGVEGDAKERERDQSEAESSQPSEAPIIKSLDEANAVIRKLFEQNRTKDEQLQATMKQTKSLLKWKAELEAENRYHRIARIVPLDVFNTTDKHSKEVQRVIDKNLDSDLDWLAGHYNLYREANRAKQFSEQHPKIAATKSASVEQYQEVNNDDSSTNSVDRTLDLAKKMFGGKR